MPLNVLDTAITQLFFNAARGPDKEEKEKMIMCLCLVVENGMESFVTSIREHAFGNPRQRAELEISKLVAFAGEKELFENPSFALSLRIAICKDFKNKGHGLEETEQTFLERLTNIFPQSLAERLFEHAMLSLHKNVTTGQEHIVPSKEKLKKHYAKFKETKRRYEAMGANTSLLASPSLGGPSRAKQTPKFTGTDTRIIACPAKCGRKKRMDAGTKTYRCPCGFIEPYPLKTQ